MSEDHRAPTWSLEARIRRRLLATLIIVWLLGSAVALGGVWHETSVVLDDSLRETADRLLLLPETMLRDGTGQELFAGISPHEDHLVYQIFDAHGRLRMRSHKAPSYELDPKAKDGIREVGVWRVLTQTRNDGARKLQVAETVAHRYEVIWGSVGWLGAALLLLVPAASVAMAVVLRSAFRALEPARAELAKRNPRTLEPLQDAGVPRELQPWLWSVNGLIEEVRIVMEEESAFASQAAHELRTPLAAARAQAQRVFEMTGEGPARQNAQALMRQLDRLARHATRLLQVARIQSGRSLRRESVDLAQIAKMVEGEFPEAISRGRLKVRVEGSPGPVRADIDAIGIALRNLVANAFNHGGDEVWVVILVQDGLVRVTDDGPGVVPSQLERLVQPFERGLTAAEGSGLGLALVNSIARYSGATLQLESPVAEGRGFSATLDFRGLNLASASSVEALTPSPT